MLSHQPRKRFGQNFLHDTQVIDHIIAAINPQAGQRMVEIGPGLGALTQRLLPSLEQLDVVELDRDLISPLENLCAPLGRLIIHQADALQFDFTQLQIDAQKLRIVGNLPYNISTPLIFHLLSQLSVIADMHFMLQKEVVERLAAPAGENAYGRLSVMVQYFCKVDALFIVNREAFHPAPKVESAIVKLVPHSILPFPAKNYSLFEQVVKAAFGQRRKTLRNALQTLTTAENLQALGIDPQLRAEKLSIADFVAISNSLHQI